MITGLLQRPPPIPVRLSKPCPYTGNIICMYNIYLYMYMFCTIRVFIPYAYGTYHTRIRIWYNHTRMVRIIVPYAYGAFETPLVYIVSSLRP